MCIRLFEESTNETETDGVEDNSTETDDGADEKDNDSKENDADDDSQESDNDKKDSEDDDEVCDFMGQILFSNRFYPAWYTECSNSECYVRVR